MPPSNISTASLIGYAFCLTATSSSLINIAHDNAYPYVSRDVVLHELQVDAKNKNMKANNSYFSHENAVIIKKFIAKLNPITKPSNATDKLNVTYKRSAPPIGCTLYPSGELLLSIIEDELSSESINESLPKHLSGRILELGSGIGFTSIGLTKRNLNVVGVDICDETIDLMKYNSKVNGVSLIGGFEGFDFDEIGRRIGFVKNPPETTKKYDTQSETKSGTLQILKVDLTSPDFLQLLPPPNEITTIIAADIIYNSKSSFGFEVTLLKLLNHYKGCRIRVVLVDRFSGGVINGLSSINNVSNALSPQGDPDLLSFMKRAEDVGLGFETVEIEERVWERVYERLGVWNEIGWRFGGRGKGRLIVYDVSLK